MSLRRAAVAMAPKLLRSNNGSQNSTMAWGVAFGHVKATGTCGGDFTFASPSAGRSVATSSRLFDKAGDSPDDSGAAARREAAEKEAAKEVRRWSSPLFSHVEVNVDDEKEIPRWANVMFVAVVVGIFGYAGKFAYDNETKKKAAKERERTERENRVRSAIDSGALRDHGRRNFASVDTEEVDPFEGLSPEEIEKLASEREGEKGGAAGNSR